jgi:hypothetical protein
MIAEGLAALVAGLSLGAPSATYGDARGEDPDGPDIATVVVSASSSDLRFRVSVPNRPVLTDDMRIRIWLDADDDRDTGLILEGVKTGLDHFLLVDRWELGLGKVGLFRCAGSVCSGGAEAAQVSFGYSDGTGTFDVDTSDLGSSRPGRLRFSVEVLSGVVFDPVARRYVFTDVRRDEAPASGSFWTFDARPLAVRAFSASPEVARAGSPFTLRLRVLPADPARPVAVACSLRVGGRLVRPRARGFARGTARCTFAVPAGAAGKQFRGVISVASGSERVTRARAGTVR